MKDVKITTFNVGQGLFNVVTGKTDQDRPYCGVFDCGNFSEYRHLNCIDQACDLLSNFNTIFDVIISHQDEDHWRTFLELFFKFNNCDYLKDNWYSLNSRYIFESIIRFSNTYVDTYLKYYVTEGIVCFKQTIEIYVNRMHAVANCLIYEEVFYPSSSWTTIFYIGDEILKTEIYPAKKNNHFIIYITGGDNATVPLSQIHYGLINLISNSKLQYVIDNSAEIYNTLKKIFPLYMFHPEAIEEAFTNATLITKPIRKACLGGLDCNTSYTLFKKIMNYFSLSCSEYGSFLTLFPLSATRRVLNDFNFEKDILSSSGEKLTNEGSVYKNATSLVTLLALSDSDIALFPGDATVHTFKNIKNKLSRDKLQLFIAPHHGSYHSNFSFIKQSDNSIVLSTEQPLKNLLKNYPPHIIHISAEHSRFGHPGKSFVDLCNGVCTGTTSLHDVVYCPDNTKTYKTFPTEKAMLTTENTGNLTFLFNCSDPVLEPSLLGTTLSNTPAKLPDNNLFIPYGGFNL